MRKALLLLLSFAFYGDLAAFELQGMRAPQLSGTPPALQIPLPSPVPADGLPARAPASFAAYQVNGAEVVVPHIGGGNQLLAVLRAGDKPEALAAKLRAAFGAAAGAKPEVITPKSKAELELAALNPGAAIVSLNAFLPAGVAALFNREPNFGGPNCFNAAFTAAGMMAPDKLRHVGNPEADQLLSMYYKSVPASALQPGDIVVYNDGDHGAYHLGGGLIFHKKSYLKYHIYRITQLDKAYDADPYEWKPGIFDSGLYDTSGSIRKKAAWRPTGAHYSFGAASADEQAKVQIILFLAEQVEYQAPRWALAKTLGYFTERLLENLVSEWSPMAKSPNPVLRAYYHQLESLRDQANQSIEVELLSSPHAQSNAYEILKSAWLPRNDYSRDIVGRLLQLYGRDQAALERTLDAIGRDFEGSPLSHVKAAN